MRMAVLMSSYNGDKYIRQQIDSILEQKCDFEINLIVRDDGSLDSTTQILEAYAENERLEWYTGENLKSAKSFMDLLYQHKGYDFYSFADQDDIWENDKLQRAIEHLKYVKGPALYCSNAALVDENLELLGGNVYKNKPHIDLYTIMCACNILGCTMVFNRELAEIIVAQERPEKIIMHDAYIACICIAVGGKIIYEDYEGMKYRQHGANVIGYNIGLIGKIKQRFQAVFGEREVTVADEAAEILEKYSVLMPEENRRWVSKVAAYRKTVVSRIALAFSRKTQYTSRKYALRLSILTGKR